MATEKDVHTAIDRILKEAEKVGAWVEEIRKQIRSGKTNYIDIKITFKVT